MRQVEPVVVVDATHETASDELPRAVRNPAFIRTLDRALSVQRPVVLAYVRGLRAKHPGVSPEELVRILERRYLAAVTGGGAAVGATAMIPGVSTPITLGLSGIETIGFLETTALFAQSVAEVHGLHVDDPDRARLIVMTLMLGKEGAQLVNHLARQALGTGAGLSMFWGDVVARSLPQNMVAPVLEQLQKSFLKHLGNTGGASFFGKALPFGIGAAVGGTANHLLGRRVLQAAREAFGPAPVYFSAELAPRLKLPKAKLRRLTRRQRKALAALDSGEDASSSVPPLRHFPYAPPPEDAERL